MKKDNIKKLINIQNIYKKKNNQIDIVNKIYE